MEFTLNISDNQKALALIEFLKTLDYVSLSLNDNSGFALSQQQISVLDEASASDKTIPLNEFKQRFKNKHGL